MSDTMSKRRRGGGGAARRAERTAPKIEAARFIERKIPNLEILNDEALEIIEANAETVLEEVGVVFADNPNALKRWKEAGAEVVEDRVHIPRGLARKLAATAPARFTQPRPQCRDRRAEPCACARLWSAFRARSGGWAALRHD